MNQILSTNMPRDDKKKMKKTAKTNNPVQISSVLKFFAIAILIFGTFMIGTGAYAIYKNQSEQKEQNLEPTISIENKTDKTILLKVMHQKNIAKIEYGWNDEEKTVINGNNGKYIEKEIQLPTGTNTLHVVVVDEDGKEITYTNQYENESKINFEVSGNKIRITYSGDTEISYMTYRWDEDEEKTIEINDTNIDQEIDAIKGLHELTVIVVDENNNTDTKTQKINGVAKPKLELGLDDQGEHFVIKTSDDEKLEKVEFEFNNDGNNYILNLGEFNLKELNYVVKTLPLQSGENTIKVTVTNSDGITEEQEKTVTK